MFNLVKQSVSLLEEIEKDLNVTFKQIGSENWAIDGAEVEGCPFCSHHDCFRVKYVEGDNLGSFYKCFSCGEHGDVIAWRAHHKNIKPYDAAKELAKEKGISVANDFNPIQEAYTLAANYYHQCLMETCDKPLANLGGKTPLQYQLEVRRHKQQTLIDYKIGYSDGGLTDYLTGCGVDEAVLEDSGLRNKAGFDFLPKNCFIYPHFVKGRASHFTFKDPTKRSKEFQTKKEKSLNGYIFYGQDTISKTDLVVMVEGENDWLAVMESGKANSTIATIGTLSKEQLDWMRVHLADKRVLTLFDPDDAGDKYRIAVERIKGSFRSLGQVLPPDGKDIDKHLSEGADIEELIKNNFVTVVVPPPASKKGGVEPPAASPLEIPWEVVDPVIRIPASITAPAMAIGGYTPPAALSSFKATNSGVVINSGREEELEAIDNEEGSLVEAAGCYWKTKRNKDAADSLIRVSDFVLELKNIFKDEGGDRNREVVLVRRDGYRSEPFLISSEAKVSLKTFTVLVAKMGEGEWLGKEMELAGLWRRVLSRSAKAEIAVPRRVGRHNKSKGWIFKNVFIGDDGQTILPDDNGIFWLNAEKTQGLRPQGLTETEDVADRFKSIPSLELGLTREETDKLTQEFINQLATNLGEMGPVLMALGWFWANVYSDMIFKHNGGMGVFLLWGPNGKGKTTIVQWMHMLMGFDGMGYTQVGQLRTAVGWMRQAEYYASLPMLLDEVRNDDPTVEALPMIRSWYDRSTRVMGTKETFGTVQREIRSNLFMAGEDIPEDPATKERCVSVRLSDKNRETDKSYQWCQAHKSQFSAIGYQWLKDSHKEDKDQIISVIRKIDKELMAAGCTPRISKNWAAVGYFAKRLADQFAPSFDFMGYMKRECKAEFETQRQESHLEGFLDFLEGAKANIKADINTSHVRRDENEVHIWFNEVYDKVAQLHRGNPRFKFSKLQLAKLFKEQPWYKGEGRITMSDGFRRRAFTLDLTKAPDQIKNIAGMIS